MKRSKWGTVWGIPVNWRSVSAIGVFIALITAWTVTYPDAANDVKWNELSRLGVYFLIIFIGLNRLVAPPSSQATEPTADTREASIGWIERGSTYLVVALLTIGIPLGLIYFFVRFVKWAWSD